MPHFDLSPSDLKSYRPDREEPADFDDFWGATLSASRKVAKAPILSPHDGGISSLRIDDVTFSGFSGDPIRAWLRRPLAAPGLLPVIVEFVGYGQGRGLAHESLHWASAGFAHLIVDTRGQGSVWGAGGETGDPYGAGPAVPGFVTRGLANPGQHYYRRVLTDGVLAIDAVRQMEGLDPNRIVVTGHSQGGGIAVAVAGLVDGLCAVMPDVPFLSHYRRAVSITNEGPYAEITRYLSVHRDEVDQAFLTLSYLDGVNFAVRAKAPALYSVGLMDPICPPSTVYAAFNVYGEGAGHGDGGGAGYGAGAGEPGVAAVTKEIDVYPYNEHEGGSAYRFARQLSWARRFTG